MELNDQQKTNLKKFELEKERLVEEAKKLFNI